MKFSKLQKIYDEKYENIPSTPDDQLQYIIDTRKVNMDKVNSEIERIKNIPWKRMSFTFPIIPYPTPRPRSTSNGCFYVEGAHDHWQYMKKNIETNHVISTITRFTVDLNIPIPSTMNGTEAYLAQLGYIMPLDSDWDNYGKTYSDAIQQILIINDNLICTGVVNKKYNIKPSVTIILEYQDGYDSKFNEKRITRSKSYKKIFGE